METAWPAPAKLNLMLRVLGRREDGYHRLQTVFQFIDHQDWLWFGPREDGQIRLRTPIPGVPEAQDLTVRAARTLQAAAGCGAGVDIHLHKVLPMGGGLGGGSSDAATTLVALNQLWGLDLDTDALAALALPLGADVPVFVRGQAAWGEGVGEQLTPVDLVQPWFLVLIPSEHVSTADVFGHPDLTRDSLPVTLGDFVRGDRRNDCLDVVRDVYPGVAEALDWLAQQGCRAFLTGTGACCFAEFSDRVSALDVRRKVPSGFGAFVARGLNRSPLLGRVERMAATGSLPEAGDLGTAN